MSALTERIGHYHRAWSIESTDTEDPGIECRCVDAPERMDWNAYAAHVAEVTEAATRAAVAADIKAQRFIDAAPDWNRSSDEAAFDDALTFAAEIAEEVGM